jgi:hypothetical protein
MNTARPWLLLAAAFLVNGIGVGGSVGAADTENQSTLPFELLRYRCVQKELGLSEHASGQIHDLIEQSNAALFEQIQKFPAPNLHQASVSERIRAMRAFNELNAPRLRKIRVPFAHRIEQLLNPAQLQRLRQIDWQVDGGWALRDPELSDALGFSREQRSRTAEIDAEFREKEDGIIYSDAIKTGSPDLPKALAAMERIYPEWKTAMLRVMTEEQTRHFHQLLGKPFDVPSLRDDAAAQQPQQFDSRKTPRMGAR